MLAPMRASYLDTAEFETDAMFWSQKCREAPIGSGTGLPRFKNQSRTPGQRHLSRSQSRRDFGVAQGWSMSLKANLAELLLITIIRIFQNHK